MALNAATEANQVSYRLHNTGTATPYLTNGSHSTARQAAVAVTGSTLTATIPARSLVPYTISR